MIAVVVNDDFKFDIDLLEYQQINVYTWVLENLKNMIQLSVWCFKDETYLIFKFHYTFVMNHSIKLHVEMQNIMECELEDEMICNQRL